MQGPLDFQYYSLIQYLVLLLFPQTFTTSSKTTYIGRPYPNILEAPNAIHNHSSMVYLTFYGGANEIGDNKIFLEGIDTRVFRARRDLNPRPDA